MLGWATVSTLVAMKLRFLIGTAASLVTLFSVETASAANPQVLRGNVPAAVARLRPLERLPGSTPLHLSIGLPWRHPEALDRLIEELYDPASPNYHRYLSSEQFTEKFGPTERDYRALIAFAEANGLTVAETHPNRKLLHVRGVAADVERVFHVTLGVYAHPTEARTFYAPNAEPCLDLEVPVLHVSGLNNHTLPRMNLRSVAVGETANAAPRAGSGTGGSFVGNDFRAAYAPGVTLTGAGEAVGLFELDGYFPSDIAAYTRLARLPSVPLTNVLVDGFNGIPTSRFPGSGNEEVALDIEMAISMAPGLSRVIVYEGHPGWSAAEVNGILNRMATDNLARQLSCSWGFDIDAISQQIFLQYAAQGQAFFLASGDYGAYSGAVMQPSDNPYITVVGGTLLTTDGARAWSAETTWDGSGGGISTLYPIPSWQEGIDMSRSRGSKTMRSFPDVSMVASNVWLMADRGRAFAVSGTSISAPLWAGFTALVNEQAAASGKPPVGFINPALYRVGQGPDNAAAFHDIVTGNNLSADSPKLFYAVRGFDLCTGWGTPTGSNLINALLEPPPGSLRITPPLGFAAMGPVGGPFTMNSAEYQLTNAGPEALNWSLVNTSAWLEVFPAGGTLTPGGPATLVTATLKAAASNLLIGDYRANVSFTNVTAGGAQSRQFSLWAGNGGFETGDFTDWVLSGDATENLAVSLDATQFNGQSTISGIDDLLFVHSGLYGAILAQSSTVGSLSQTLPTRAGQPYVLSFWLDNPATGSPNQFRVSWDGNTLFERSNMAAFTWTNLQFTVRATGTNTVLRFDFHHARNALGLDDISVQPLEISMPSIQSVTQADGALTFTWSATPGAKYQAQYSTDLNVGEWSNFGRPVTATRDTLSVTDFIRPDSLRLYRVVLVF